MTQRGPFTGVHFLRIEMDRLWEARVTGRARLRTFTWQPPTDVYQTADGGFVRIEVAGLSEGDFRVAFEDGLLSVAGIRSEPTTQGCVNCQQMEIAYGRFWSEARVPWRVDPDAIRADYRAGFLTVWLPSPAAGSG
jgi:HSP20 family protein